MSLQTTPANIRNRAGEHASIVSRADAVVPSGISAWEAVSYTAGEYTAYTTFSLKVGSAGNLVMEDANGTQVTWPAQAGEIIIGGIAKIVEAGTTATNLIAFV